MNQDNRHLSSTTPTRQHHREQQHTTDSLSSSSSLLHPTTTTSDSKQIEQRDSHSHSSSQSRQKHSRFSSSSSSTSHRQLEEDSKMIDYTNREEDEQSFRLPSLSPLRHETGKDRMETGDGYLMNASLPRRNSLTRMQQSTTKPSAPMIPSSTSSSPNTSTSRADVFMASLLRAAQTPDTVSPLQSPMSVHSMVDSSSFVPSHQHQQGRPKKRRTSSVQEPLQGSALDSIRRAHGSKKIHTPRRSETPSDYMSRVQHHASSVVNPMASDPNLSKANSLSITPSRQSFRSTTEWDRPLLPQQERYSIYPPQSQPQPPPQPQQQHQRVYSGGGASPSSSSHLHPSRSIQSNSSHSFSQEGTSSQSSRDPTTISSGSGSISSNRDTSSSNQPSFSMTGGVLGKRPPHFASHETSNRQLAARAAKEEESWFELTQMEKFKVVQGNILQARDEILQADHFPLLSPQTTMTTTTNTVSPPTLVTNIRCMYANIAQKSYGSEKRFLCPPPVVKINGPMRLSKWACVRVIPGESSTPSSMSMRNIQISGGASGEEEAIVDGNREARFGKLHVGSLSDARGKTFRLQINLLRVNLNNEEGKARSMMNHSDSPFNSHPSSVMPSNAWSTFHSSPISVISKPARKSVRTRAASPAIASGSIVCLYNRLNSQTVRTKYLAVESSDSSQAEVRKLVARQDGWERFSIELLARPVHDPAIIRANQRGIPWDDWGITYGSIICLRDINTNVCSDPMLICKVDKGKVEMSSVMGGGSNSISSSSPSSNAKIRFQVVGKDREAARRILLGGTGRRGEGDQVEAATTMEQSSAVPFVETGVHAVNTSRRESGESSSDSSMMAPILPTNITSGHSSNNNNPLEPNGSVGGAVIQMQKVTLMHIQPRRCSKNIDELECDLGAPRAYLCSTAFEGIPEQSTKMAFARSMERLRARHQAVEQGAMLNDEEDEQLSNQNRTETTATTTDSPSSIYSTAAGATGSTSTLPCPVGYVQPPPLSESRSMDGSRSINQVDVLEDPFCWTIVTISQSDMSYIEANARQNTGYPHLAASPLPITPYPCLAAQPSYDVERHAIAATIHDFYYQDSSSFPRSSQPFSSASPKMMTPPNNVCASANPGASNVAHDIWLAHSGPLEYETNSAGPYMSDVIFRLPLMEHLITLNKEFHGIHHLENEIRLPILLVRASQGVTFLSRHWLNAYSDHDSNQEQGVEFKKRDQRRWTFSIL